MEYFKDSNNLIFSRVGCAISTTSGALSALSSILVISIILRTQSKLSSTYHLIMFFMSFWDTIGSIATALTTIPMPADVNMVYDFEFKSYGTAGTCEAQAAIIGISTSLVLASSCALNLFYLSTIRFHVAEERFKWRVLPLILFAGCVITVLVLVLGINSEYLNPQPFLTYCFSGVYPYNCDDKRRDSNVERAAKERECIRGGDADASTQNLMNNFLLMGTGSFFMITCVSLLLIILTVFQNELIIRRFEKDLFKNRPGLDSGDDDEIEFSVSEPLEVEPFKETRAVLSQALMYICAFLLAYMWDVILVMTTAGKIFKPRPLLDGLRLFFTPMQGFFNALIFIYTKTYTLRRSAHDSPSFYSSVKTVLFQPSSIPELLLSRIDMVEKNIVEIVEEELEPDREGEFDDRPIYDLGENGIITPASIDSGFLSRETPSFVFSKDASTNDVSFAPKGTIVADNTSISTPGISKFSPPSYGGDISYEESKQSNKEEEENKSSLGADNSNDARKKSTSGKGKSRRAFYSLPSDFSMEFFRKEEPNYVMR